MIEVLVLDAVAEGLSAKIMHVGTLSARYSDGEFKINAGTNSSMGRIKTFAIPKNNLYTMQVLYRIGHSWVTAIRSLWANTLKNS